MSLLKPSRGGKSTATASRLKIGIQSQEPPLEPSQPEASQPLELESPPEEIIVDKKSMSLPSPLPEGFNRNLSRRKSQWRQDFTISATAT